MIKVSGKTKNGGGTCGHRIHAGEAYFIKPTKRGWFAVCGKCVGYVGKYRVVRIPEDLVNGVIDVK